MINGSNKERRLQAFTIIELAVVLAVLGLLIGSIIASTSLRKAAELRELITTAQTYASAVQQFQQQYGYFPGDFPQAVKVWGKADGDTTLTTNCATPATDAASNAATCNGDGNGIIDNGVNYEFLRAWQQLRLSGLIMGNYTGVSATAAGVNEPTLRNFPNSTFSFYNTTLAAGATPCNAQACAGATNAYDGDYTNAIHFGTYVNDAHTSGLGAVLTGEQASSIDKKYDDGLPALGHIRTWKPAALASCASGSTSDSASTYIVSGTTATCSLIFMSGYRAAKNGVE